jgi:propanol-preferring alcohol dehydrogenase
VQGAANGDYEAMVLVAPRRPLELTRLPLTQPSEREVLIRVRACGVCRTDLHIVDGELTKPKLPLVPGHEIIGEIAALGEGAGRFTLGERVGVSWLASTDGECRYCRAGQENLCESALFTGYTVDGGYATYTLADERYCLPISDAYTDIEAAPLMCAGLIGYRSLVKAGDAEKLGIYGFGAAAHIIAQVAVFQGRKVYALTRPGDTDGQQFARELGAVWAGDSTSTPPVELDVAIIFAPIGALVPAALRAVRKGGRVVCGGIHMSDIPSFPYELLWGERTLSSVANVTRRDTEEFLALAPRVPVRTEVQPFPLSEANEALARLRGGRIRGAAVLVP